MAVHDDFSGPQPYVTVATTTEGFKVIWLHAPNAVMSALEAKALASQLLACVAVVDREWTGKEEES